MLGYLGAGMALANQLLMWRKNIHQLLLSYPQPDEQLLFVGDVATDISTRAAHDRTVPLLDISIAVAATITSVIRKTPAQPRRHVGAPNQSGTSQMRRRMEPPDLSDESKRVLAGPV